MSLRGAILGFLALEPTSGYALKQRFDGSVGSFWSATQSQIYRELHQLARDGLVAMEARAQSGRPDSKHYSLTKRGHEALAAWLDEPLDPLLLRHPLLLKVVFAAQLPPKQLDRLLAGYAEGLHERRAEYQRRLDDPRIFDLARSARERTLWRLSIEHGLVWCDTELAWIEHTRKQMAKSGLSKRRTERG